MIQLGSPFTRAEIVPALSAEIKAVHTYFADIPEDQFFNAPAGVWSPADNLVHLIKAVSPITKGLKLPKIALRLRFGKVKHDSKSFEAVRHRYVDGVLADGGEAGPPYLPEVKETSSAERTRILAKWQSMDAALRAGLKGWSDRDLDNYQVVHPLIGPMTVREILLFTLYHNMHHVNDVRRLLGQSEVEWFG